MAKSKRHTEPATEQIAKLPKWAQDYTDDLIRERASNSLALTHVVPVQEVNQ